MPGIKIEYPLNLHKPSRFSGVNLIALEAERHNSPRKPVRFNLKIGRMVFVIIRSELHEFYGASSGGESRYEIYFQFFKETKEKEQEKERKEKGK